MGKGVGSPRNRQLGYVLLLMLEAKAYAADFSLGEDDEEFIGITNVLEDVKVWKKKIQARQTVVKYLDFLIEQLEENSQVEFSIRKLKRLSNGKLKDEPEEDLIFEQTKKLKIKSKIVILFFSNLAEKTSISAKSFPSNLPPVKKAYSGEREYLFPHEVEKLIKAARHVGRHKLRDATLILSNVLSWITQCGISSSQMVECRPQGWLSSNTPSQTRTW